MLDAMSTQRASFGDPQWDLADRLAKSLRISGVSVQDMADHLGLHRNSVGAWLHGRGAPSTKHLKIWALYTGVRYPWLKGDGTSIHYARARDDIPRGKDLARRQADNDVGLAEDTPPTRWLAA